jgi:hypothetical protein
MTLRFEIRHAVARAPGSIRLARPLWLYLGGDVVGGPTLHGVHLAQLAIRGEGGRPILIDRLRLDCGPGVSLTSAYLGRYDQARIYAGGSGLSFPFLDPAGERRCSDALRRSNHLAMTVTSTDANVPPFTIRASLPIAIKANLAIALWRRETAWSRNGRCAIARPPPPPI